MSLWERISVAARAEDFVGVQDDEVIFLYRKDEGEGSAGIDRVILGDINR